MLVLKLHFSLELFCLDFGSELVEHILGRWVRSGYEFIDLLLEFMNVGRVFAQTWENFFHIAGDGLISCVIQRAFLLLNLLRLFLFEVYLLNFFVSIIDFLILIQILV